MGSIKLCVVLVAKEIEILMYINTNFVLMCCCYPVMVTYAFLGNVICFEGFVVHVAPLMTLHFILNSGKKGNKQREDVELKIEKTKI